MRFIRWLSRACITNGSILKSRNIGRFPLSFSHPRYKLCLTASTTAATTANTSSSFRPSYRCNSEGSFFAALYQKKSYPPLFFWQLLQSSGKSRTWKKNFASLSFRFSLSLSYFFSVAPQRGRGEANKTHTFLTGWLACWLFTEHTYILYTCLFWQRLLFLTSITVLVEFLDVANLTELGWWGWYCCCCCCCEWWWCFCCCCCWSTRVSFGSPWAAAWLWILAISWEREEEGITEEDGRNGARGIREGKLARKKTFQLSIFPSSSFLWLGVKEEQIPSDSRIRYCLLPGLTWPYHLGQVAQLRFIRFRNSSFHSIFYVTLIPHVCREFLERKHILLLF